MGAYEQKLHTRRGVMRVMLLNKQKPYYCTEDHLRKCRGYIHRKRVILLREI